MHLLNVCSGARRRVSHSIMVFFFFGVPTSTGAAAHTACSIARFLGT